MMILGPLTATTVAIVHRRVGVAKTTTAWNMAHELCRLGHRVLLIDADGQAELTRLAGFHSYELAASGRDLGGVLLGELSARDAIVRSVGALEASSSGSKAATRLDLLPSSHRLDEIVLPELIRSGAEPGLLQWAVGPVRADYDFVVIDGPQSMSFITECVLSAADLTIVPVATGLGDEAEDELRDILDTCCTFRSDLDRRDLWVLPTRYKRRSTRHQRSLRRIRESFPERSRILLPVHHSSWVEAAAQSRAPIREVHAGLEATESYRQLAKAVAIQREELRDIDSDEPKIRV